MIKVITLCERIEDQNGEKVAVFHFRGVYKGDFVKSIEANIGPFDFISVAEEYLIDMRVLSVSDGILRGEIFQVRTLNEQSLGFFY